MNISPHKLLRENAFNEADPTKYISVHRNLNSLFESKLLYINLSLNDFPNVATIQLFKTAGMEVFHCPQGYVPC